MGAFKPIGGGHVCPATPHVIVEPPRHRYCNRKIDAKSIWLAYGIGYHVRRGGRKTALSGCHEVSERNRGSSRDSGSAGVAISRRILVVVRVATRGYGRQLSGIECA